MPDLQGATSGVTGLRLGASVSLLFDKQFRIELGTSLGRPEAPEGVPSLVEGW